MAEAISGIAALRAVPVATGSQPRKPLSCWPSTRAGPLCSGTQLGQRWASVPSCRRAAEDQESASPITAC